MIRTHSCTLLALLAPAIFTAVLTVPAAPAAAQDPEALTNAARSLWDDDSSANREKVRTDMLNAAAGDVKSVLMALKAGPKFNNEVTRGVDQFSFKGRDGQAQISGRYIPTTYDASKKMPMLVWLHGGATGERRDRGTAQVEILKDWCEKAGIILLAPSAYSGAAWWEFDGAYNVLRSMKLTKGIYNIDENKTFVAGFSDGGSGVYWFLDHFGTYFAGGVCISGHPSVAGAEQAYGQFSYVNLAQRPLLVCLGGKDRLYPPSRIQPFIDDMTAAGVKVTSKVYAEAGHTTAMIAEALGDMEAFIKSNERNSQRAAVQLQWDGTPALNRVDWLKIDQVREAVTGEPEMADPNTYIGRAALGCDYDANVVGKLKVTHVTEGSAAAIAGVMVGDTIDRFNTDKVTSAAQLEQIVNSLQPGTLSHVWVIRDVAGAAEVEEVELIVEFPPARVAFPRDRVMSSLSAT
ncbi:MAG: hypothetical protein AB7S36_22025, partial [Planctomycetota bacterium]